MGLSRRALLSLLAAFAAVAAVAGAALAASDGAALRPLTAASYGGGSDPSRTQDVVALVAFRTDAGAKHLDLWVDVEDFNCKTDSEAFVTARNVPIGAGGSFAAGGPFTDRSGSPGRYSLSGRFVRRDLASGSVTMRAGPCSMGTLGWKAGDPDAGVGSGAKQPGGEYVGTLSQRSTRVDVRLPFVLRLSADGEALAGVAARPNVVHGKPAVCGAATRFVQVWFDHLAGTTFTDRENLTTPGGQGGQTELSRIVWTGRFGGRAATGTWDETADVERSDHSLVGTCSTGPLTWKAIG